MTPSRSASAVASFYLSALRLEKMPQIVGQLPGRGLQAVVTRALLVAGARARLYAGAGVGPADDALGGPAGDHHLDVAVRLRRRAAAHVLELGDVAIDEEPQHPRLGEVVLIGRAERQRHR